MAPDRGLIDASPHEPPPPLVLHITDLHVGTGEYAVQALGLLLREVLPTLAPTVTINSGDSTESGAISEWSTYQGVLQGQVPGYPAYLEVPGNHDWKLDNGQSFLAGSQTGKAGGGAYGITPLDPPAGRLRVVRTNTADTDLVAVAAVGYFGQAQHDALLQQLPSPIPVAQTVVVGHHPIKGLLGLQTLGTDGRMQDLLEQSTAAVYLCGHLHSSALSWLGNTLVVQGPTLGDQGSVKFELGFVVLTLDTDGPAARVVRLSKDIPAVSWPLALITRPADRNLGGTNPRARAVAPGSELKVRALGFAPSGILSAELRVDAGPWSSMSSSDQRLWLARPVAPGARGQHSLEVRVRSAEGTNTQAISFEVGP